MSDTTGFAPVHLVNTNAVFGDTKTFGGSPVAAGATASPVAVPLASIELGVALPLVADRCEAGVLLSFLRVGGEVRCGLRPGELGLLEAALSLGAAPHLAAKPAGIETRVGFDFSLRTQFTPVLDVYLARIPWQRSSAPAFAFGPEGGGRDWRVVRDEWRLSIPVGVASRYGVGSSVTFAVVPEFTLAASNEVVSGAEAVEQYFAVYFAVVLGGEYAFASQPQQPSSSSPDGGAGPP
ncbi:MAG TPA: hypothetical protein VJR89_43410 [Polyangiales bacterium]|nr:hypothetical protein [Polyangiales bacterium]